MGRLQRLLGLGFTVEAKDYGEPWPEDGQPDERKPKTYRFASLANTAVQGKFEEFLETKAIRKAVKSRGFLSAEESIEFSRIMGELVATESFSFGTPAFHTAVKSTKNLKKLLQLMGEQEGEEYTFEELEYLLADHGTEIGIKMGGELIRTTGAEDDGSE